LAAPSAIAQDAAAPPAAQGDGAPTAALPPVPQAAPQEPGGAPPQFDGFRVGDFTFKPGGRVKLDVIRDFNPIDNEDAFDTRTIPINAGEGVNSNVHAKETRLSLDVRGDVDGEELQMYIETDFYGTSSALRLRHAYGRYNGLLAGQTWSTFVDDDNFPRTIDFESPTAFALIRQAQVRWTQKFKAMTWSAAVEDNKSAIVVPLGIPGTDEYPIPDIVNRLRFDMPRGHITTAGFVGWAQFRPLDEEPDTAVLWGTMLSANFSTFGKDTAYGVISFGDGIGRYRGGTTAVPDFEGKLHAVRAQAFMGGYEHFWADRWSTNAVYSVASAPEEPFYTSSLSRRLEYAAVNLLFWFLGDRGWTGIEYLYGSHEVFGPSPNFGDAHRVQYAVRFNLP
jgi:hypothetical protein